MAVRRTDTFRNIQRITRAGFMLLLKGSPAASVAGAVYDYAVLRGVDALLIAAIFNHESGKGLKGWATKTHSWGNTRPPSYGVKEIGAYQQDTDVFYPADGSKGKYPGRCLCAYKDWYDGGISTVARLVEHVYKNRTRIEEIFDEELYPNQVWAPSGDENDPEGYLHKVLSFMSTYQNQTLSTPVGGNTMAYRLAFSAGHHNTDGGNPFEYVTTGEMTEALTRAALFQGYEVFVPQPDGPDADKERGDGDYPGGLQAVGRAVVAEDRNKPFVLFLESHTQGGPKVPGMFGIYPDMRGDLDTDARDRLIPLINQKVSRATGLKIYGNGLLPESRTGVGLGGSRLGVLYATEPIKDHCTRILVEYGAHDTSEATIHRSPGFYDKAARATIEAISEWLGQPIKPWDTAGKVPINPAPTPPPAPVKESAVKINVPGRGETWIVDPILTYWRDCGEIHNNPNALGYPVTGMYAKPGDESTLVQWFERGRVEVRGDQITSALVGLELAQIFAPDLIIGNK